MGLLVYFTLDLLARHDDFLVFLFVLNSVEVRRVYIQRRWLASSFELGSGKTDW